MFRCYGRVPMIKKKPISNPVNSHSNHLMSYHQILPEVKFGSTGGSFSIGQNIWNRTCKTKTILIWCMKYVGRSWARQHNFKSWQNLLIAAKFLGDLANRSCLTVSQSQPAMMLQSLGPWFFASSSTWDPLDGHTKDWPWQLVYATCVF